MIIILYDDDNDITTKSMQERIENLFVFVKNENKIYRE